MVVGLGQSEEVREETVTYFVPGLPQNVTEDDLGKAFEKYGKVVRASIAQERGSKTKCFGYVEMVGAESRDAICTDLHEFGEVTVRALLTKEALHTADVKKIHIGKLPAHITAEAIREAFSQFGAVLDVHTPKKVSTGERQNYGFVTFGSEESYDAALEAANLDIEGHVVDIKPSAQSKGEAVFDRKGKAKGNGKGGPDDPDAGITRDRKGGFKYFVPGLPESVTDDELRTHFGKYGQMIDAAVVTEKGTDISRGFGYITMAESGSRDSILNDKHVLGGKEINVLLTKDALSGAVKKIHLGNLDVNVSAEAIREVFARFGTVLDVHTPKNPKTGERQNFGFVTLGSEKAFQAALRAGSAVVEGCEVRIKPAAQTEPGGHSGKGGIDMGKGAGKGFDPYMMDWGAPSKGFDKGFGKAWGGPDPWADPWAKGCGKGPYGGKDPWAADPWAKGGGKDPWGGKGYGKDMWGGDPWAGKGGDPWAGKGGDPWAGKGDPWGGKGGDPWAGKGGDPWAGKGGDPWASKGGGDPWAGKGGGDPWAGKGGDPWAGKGGDPWAGKGGGKADPYAWASKGPSKGGDPWAGKGDFGKGGGYGKGRPGPY